MTRITGVATLTVKQRLQGASLLIFSNKTDIAGSMSDEDIRKASYVGSELCGEGLTDSGARTGLDQDAQMDYHPMQCHNRLQCPRRHQMGCRRCERPAFLVLISAPYNIWDGISESFLAIPLVHLSGRQAAKVMARVQSFKLDDASSPSSTYRAFSHFRYALSVDFLTPVYTSSTMHRWTPVIPLCDPDSCSDFPNPQINKYQFTIFLCPLE